MSSLPQQGERKRAPSVVFSCISVAILLLMMTALNQAQPPPPPTPEYAPEAVQALKDPPREQTSKSGEGPLGTGGGAPGLPPPGDRKGSEIPKDRVRRCIGDPPRQIEDTQSPPCVAFFEGDNGGKTWRGVTPDEIRIAIPGVFAAENGQVLERLFQFFNKRFEFYGRKMVPIIAGCGGSAPNDMKRCAATVYEEEIFASMSYSDVGGNQYHYYDALAGKGIVSVASHPDRRTEADMAEHAPYEWMYLPSFDKIGRHLGSYVCDQLEGRDAAHGGPDVIAIERKFGLVFNRYPDGSPEADVSALRARLRSCGIDALERRVTYKQEGLGFQQEDQDTHQEVVNAIGAFRTQGVTSVICVCHTSTMKQLARDAQAAGYQPEWIINSYAYTDGNAFWSGFVPASQAAHAFGLTFWNKQVEPENMPWYWATQEVDPGFDYEGNPFVFFGAHYLYGQLLLLASGIQMAGPNLTPQTFQKGLHETVFPNPDGPYFEGKVGFEDNDHSFVNDAAIVWWDPAGRDPWIRTQGAFCYVRRGERNRIDSYPNEDEAFDPRICDRRHG